MAPVKTPGQIAADRRQQLRRCNATVPIPSGKHKKPRAAIKQQLRKEYSR